MLTVEDFIIACNNPDLRDLNSVNLMTNQAMRQSPAYYWHHSDMRAAIKEKILNPQLNLVNNKVGRPWKFVCLLRRPAPIRWAISAELMDYKESGEGLMSMICDTQVVQQNGIAFEKLEDGYYEWMRNTAWSAGQCIIEGYNEAHHKFQKTSELIYRYDSYYPFWIENDTNALTNPLIEDQIWKFTDSYLHLVSETFTNANEGVCLSEKIFKPIWYMQPFVVFGTPHTLSALKNLGYKTFDTWIDESYDSIEDEVERFYSAIDSIRNFVKQDYETLNQIMKEMLPTLEHNAQVLDKNNSSLYVNLKLNLLNALR